MAAVENTERSWWTLVAVCAATFMLLVDVTIVQVALPTIQRHLHSSFSDLEWVIDAYALSLASILLTCGALADRFGRKRDVHRRPGRCSRSRRSCAAWRRAPSS